MAELSSFIRDHRACTVEKMHYLDKSLPIPSSELKGLPSGSAVKNLPAMQEPQETWVRSLGREDTLEEGVVTHSSVLAWRIP